MEVARVERSRGYVTTLFVLETADGTFYESAAFRWRRAAPPPDEGDARAAYDALVEELLADGWTPGEEGPTWYETSFERPLAVPIDLQVTPEPEPEPEPPPRPAAKPAPTPRPVSSITDAAVSPPQLAQPTRRVPPVALVAVGACIGALAAFLLVGRDRQPIAVATQRTATTAPPTAHVQVQAAPPAQRPKPLDVVIAGARGNGSWLEARRGSQTGRVLYSGLVEPGRRVHLRGRVIWTRFGAAGNLDITVDGRPVTLTGTYDKTFRARR